MGYRSAANGEMRHSSLTGTSPRAIFVLEVAFQAASDEQVSGRPADVSLRKVAISRTSGRAPAGHRHPLSHRIDTMLPYHHPQTTQHP